MLNKIRFLFGCMFEVEINVGKNLVCFFLFGLNVFCCLIGFDNKVMNYI